MSLNLLYLTTFLKNHNYPLVHSMNPDETAEVFHKSNRCFLICWALNLLSDDYTAILKGREKDEVLLADIVFCLGFCTEKEKAGFFNGDLEITNQFKIFNRIFTFIEQVKQSEQLTNEVQPITLEDLNVLENKDLNLFPTFAIKPVSDKEIQCQIENVQKEIEILSLEFEKGIEQNNSKKITEIKKEFIKDIIAEINENLSKFELTVKSIGKEVSSNIEPNYEIDPKSVELLKECNEKLQIVSQYIENLKTINDFVIKDIEMPVDKVSLLIARLADQIKQY